ncbi:uncharacterized protein LOC110882326 [Helianthus annuus]|uniref:uncharacterized protein LOC110882326 n=1 Tax=Helianthus annuus TaxID=4232 RepID=UPI000B907408|nr:uncharacterized protein LOC110882326 [Helianthus annuus]
MSGRDDKESTSTSIHEQGNISLQCPKLTESNYTQRAILMETILKAYSLWDTVVSKEGVDEKKAHTTKAMIFQTLSGDTLMQVTQYESAKEVWDAIEVRYLGADMVQKARLQTLRSELNETISSFASKLGGIKSKFKSLGTTIKDKKIVRKLLIYVPKKFLPTVASIEQYSEIDKMTFEEVVSRTTAFEELLKSQSEPENNNLLMASLENHSGNWHHGRGRGGCSFRGGRGRG